MNTSHNNNWKKRRLLFIPLILLGVIAISGLVMLLWNLLIPEIFGLAPITYWQAIGLMVLSKILFGGWNFGKRGRRPSFGGQARREKFLNMTEEEKQEFKAKWKERCGR